jgi:hypothetical protein
VTPSAWRWHVFTKLASGEVAVSHHDHPGLQAVGVVEAAGVIAENVIDLIVVIGRHVLALPLPA